MSWKTPNGYALRHYYNVDVIEQRWREHQESGTSAAADEPRISEHGQVKPSDIEIALLQNFLGGHQQPMHQQMLQASLNSQMHMQLQQQWLQQMQAMPVPSPPMPNTNEISGNAVTTTLAGSHQGQQADESEDSEADLARCYEQSVNAFLDPENFQEEASDDCGDGFGAVKSVEGGNATEYDPKSDLPMVEAKEPPRRQRKGAMRYTCSFHLHQGYVNYKHVVPVIIGRGGENTRRIYQSTGAKVRVRGRGSGHKEAGTSEEAPTGPMLTVSSQSESDFQEAVKMTVRLIFETQERMEKMYPGIKEELGGDLCWGVQIQDGRAFRLSDSGELIPEEMSKLNRKRW